MMFVESYVHLFEYLVKSMKSFCLIVVLTRFLYSVLFQYFIMLFIYSFNQSSAVLISD